MKLVLTCEHGGNIIPKAYAQLFNDKDILNTHLGYDLGALDVLEYLKPLAEASFYSINSRLLIELNRSLFHKQLFSEFTKSLSKTEKNNIIETYYLPYRTAVEHKIANLIGSNNKVLHLSIHSFTPKLNNEIRNCDIGLLYNSLKKEEQTFCRQLKAEILKTDSGLNVRFNYPYLGKADGFTTFLRKQFLENYLGIEIEVNQKFNQKNKMQGSIKEILYIAVSNLIN
ncbi:N-formylglutamate amidohydrolase [Winogradskyella sp. J14-2]|uniref:N-formylglutamate amidohydrolase n=1 Tax=Winogradskyella sp. J14-2 TaxID=1936080 RepID=UPI00097286B9|nr:N-formylglutamate amidohydrolase [Winogradskyella sp. J14-2]APY09040.1 N-formylglutamate amidohydrolase [Winogradskyella sp. J14-2]